MQKLQEVHEAYQVLTKVICPKKGRIMMIGMIKVYGNAKR